MDADMVLLGGDLFHDNKPSRNTIVKAMRILKKYCLNDRPVSFQVLSDQNVNFPSVGRVNYEDPHMNVGLPVFTIHGNHDDPAGHGRLSAVDILSECNLVNYFGNADLEGSSIGRLRISPVLLQKGKTFVALYGLGNIRDERLARLFKTPGSVEWERPEGDEESDSPDSKWYNIFVLHQNRAKHSPKNYLDEACLPSFLDFILWGHEHQCIPEAQQSAYSEFDILQAGSTVATSLSEGEADPKHCFLLEIRESAYRIIKLPLETVRPFSYKQLSLKAHEQELDPEDAESLEAFLERKVAGQREAALAAAPRSAAGRETLPLVRLKVDYTGFSTVNVQRFGQRFVSRVANPQDILVFCKQAQRRAAQEGPLAEGLEGLRPEQLDQSRIEDLVAENLGPSGPLEILIEEELREALQGFVEKDDRQAIDACVKQVLKKIQSEVSQGSTRESGAAERNLDAAIRSLVGQRAEEARAAAAERNAGDEPAKAAPETGTGGAAAASDDAAASPHSPGSLSDGGPKREDAAAPSPHPAPPARQRSSNPSQDRRGAVQSARASRGRRAGTKRRRALSSSDSGSSDGDSGGREEEEQEDDSGGEGISASEGSERPWLSSAKRTRTSSQARAGLGIANAAAAAPRRSSLSFTSSGRPGSAATAGGTPCSGDGSPVEVIDGSDDDNGSPPRSARERRRPSIGSAAPTPSNRSKWGPLR